MNKDLQIFILLNRLLLITFLIYFDAQVVPDFSREYTFKMTSSPFDIPQLFFKSAFLYAVTLYSRLFLFLPCPCLLLQQILSLFPKTVRYSKHLWKVVLNKQRMMANGSCIECYGELSLNLLLLLLLLWNLKSLSFCFSGCLCIYIFYNDFNSCYLYLTFYMASLTPICYL